MDRRAPIRSERQWADLVNTRDTSALWREMEPVDARRFRVRRRRERDFERAMAEMAADPAVRRASRRITREFGSSETDGL